MLPGRGRSRLGKEPCYEQAEDEPADVGEERDAAPVRVGEPCAASRDRLDRPAHTLLDRETLDEDEAYAAADIRPGAAPAAIARGGAAGMAVSDG